MLHEHFCRCLGVHTCKHFDCVPRRGIACGSLLVSDTKWLSNVVEQMDFSTRVIVDSHFNRCWALSVFQMTKSYECFMGVHMRIKGIRISKSGETNLW